MTTDFRTLCAELVDELNGLSAHVEATTPFETVLSGIRAYNRARAPLAEPEPEGPTPQPADGEAAKLVAWLRKTSRAAFMDGWPNEESINLACAADLLERLSLPLPS